MQLTLKEENHLERKGKKSIELNWDILKSKNSDTVYLPY